MVRRLKRMSNVRESSISFTSTFPIPALKIGTWSYITRFQVMRALILGRQAGDEILPKFFPPLGSSLNKPALVLRALLWLAPCPEAEIMLLDWARTYPRSDLIGIVNRNLLVTKM